MTSGSAVLNKTSREAARDNVVFMHDSECYDMECLMNLPTKDIMDSISWIRSPYWAMEDLNDLPWRYSRVGAIAVVDGDVLTMTPFEAFESGMAMDVPVIIGNTTQELDYSGIPGPPGDVVSWSWEDYVDKVTTKLSTFPGLNISEVLEMYPVGMVTPEYQYTTMATDIRVRCPLDVLASKIEKAFKSPVFRYVTTSFPTELAHLSTIKSANMFELPPHKSRYSVHGMDIFAFFDTLKDYYNITSDDQTFTGIMQSEIAHFAKTGRPQTVSWLPFPGKVAIIDGNITMVDKFHKDKCSFWLRKGFLKYSWIN